MSLQECFEQVIDPRKASGLRTPLPELLCMITMGYMSGLTGYRGIGTFMKENREELMDLFNLKHPPIGKTQLRTILQKLDFTGISQAFFKWMATFVNIEEGEWLSGDGKALGSTVTDAHGNAQEYELMVRLFSQKLGIVTHSTTTKSKSTELKAMQGLLKNLELKGVIITLDALHCQKKTVEIIVGSQNDYLIEVKGNQPALLGRVRQIKAANEPMDTCLTEEKNRGRRENRYHEIYAATSDIPEGWKAVKTVIYVHRYGYRPDKKNNNGEYSEHHYYICSHPFGDASKVADGIRKHWGIENKIHFVKDTHFNEDNNGVRHNHAAAILSVFQDIVINIYRCKGFNSLKTATTRFANKFKQLSRFLKAEHISDL
jgi:predicted transposase YbfD/YdcC